MPGRRRDALPYPLVEELLAIDEARLALVNPEAPRIDHGDLPGDWVAADLDGNRYRLQLASRTNAKLGPFLVPASLSAPDGTVPAATSIFISCWDHGGFSEQCSARCRSSRACQARMQFGKPLADFQTVRFAVADASVAVRGLHELAKYTISRPESLPAQVHSADALVLRFKAADTARQVLRTSTNCSGAWALRRVRRQRARPAHPAADPVAAGHRGLGLRLISDVRDGSWRPCSVSR